MAQNEYKQFLIQNPLKSQYIRIRGVGYRELMRPSMIRRPSGSGDYLFMYFYDPVHIGLDKKAPQYEGGSMMIWEPGKGQFYGNLKNKYRHTWVHCEGVWIEKIISEIRYPTNKPVPVSDAGLVELYVDRIYQEITRERSDRIIVRNLIDNWLREMKRDSQSSTSRVPDWLIDIRNFMEVNYRDTIALDELAAKVHKSVPHFSAEFKKYTDCPPIEYIIRLRLNEALHLLPDINLSIGEIAERVGYEDIYHFSKLFKKHHGISPMAMRKRMVTQP